MVQQTCSLMGVRAATAAPEAATAVEVDSGGATGGWERDDIEDRVNVEATSCEN